MLQFCDTLAFNAALPFRTVIAALLLGSFGMATTTDAQEKTGATAAAEERLAEGGRPLTVDARQSLGQGITLARLSNGMIVIVQENHTAPVATVRCYVDNTGSAYEGEYLGVGISHLLEHLVAGGSTTKRSEKEISKLVDSLGGKTNAYTSNDVTAYYIDAPSRRVDLAIELVSDSMQYAAIVPEEYERELGVVQRELEMGKSQRNRVAYQAMKKLVFTDHPMQHPIIGYLPVLQKVSRQDVLDFYHSRYVPQNMLFVVVGDVKTDDVLEQVRERFANFQRTTERKVVLGDEPDQASPRSIRVPMPGQTSELHVAWPTVPLQHPDLYPLDVASYLLTSGNSSRLQKRLKIDQPLAVSVSSASYTPGFVKGWFQVSAECGPEKVDNCRTIIFEEIERLQTELVSEEELAKVKQQKSAEHIFGGQTVQSQAESLARSYLSTGDPLFDDQYVAGIRSVTPEQIREVAQKYFRPHRLNTVTIVPPAVEEQIEQEERSTELTSEVVKKVLPNGLTLLVKRQATKPIVTMQAFVKAGVLADSPETSGLAALTASLMDKGTEKYSADEISAYFDRIGGSLSTASQRNTSMVQAAVLQENGEEALDYAFEVLFKPTFPEGEFKKAQQRQLQMIAARTADPRSEILDFWTRKLPVSSPYSRTTLGAAETVSSLTVDQVREFHGTYFVPNNMVLSVFGDVDPEQMVAFLTEKFGGVPKADDFKFPEFSVAHSPAKLPAPATGDVVHRLRNRRPDTALILAGYPSVSVMDQEHQAAVQMLNAVLTGGGGAGGRLFDELRGEQLVYYVFGMEMTGLAPGYFVFMAQTQPETAQEVIDRIKDNLRKIQTEGIPEDEFELAREKLLAQHAMSNTTAASQGFQAALYELYGLGYDYDQSYPERVSAVTIDDVKKVVEDYFQQAIIATSSPDEAAEAPAQP